MRCSCAFCTAPAIGLSFTLYITNMEIKHYPFARLQGVNTDEYVLLRVLLDADITTSAAAQPQINPLRATENPHSVIMTGLLAQWHPQQLERPYCRGATGTGVRVFRDQLVYVMVFLLSRM